MSREFHPPLSSTALRLTDRSLPSPILCFIPRSEGVPARRMPGGLIKQTFQTMMQLPGQNPKRFRSFPCSGRAAFLQFSLPLTLSFCSSPRRHLLPHQRECPSPAPTILRSSILEPLARSLGLPRASPASSLSTNEQASLAGRRSLTGEGEEAQDVRRPPSRSALDARRPAGGVVVAREAGGGGERPWNNGEG